MKSHFEQGQTRRLMVVVGSTLGVGATILAYREFPLLAVSIGVTVVLVALLPTTLRAIFGAFSHDPTLKWFMTRNEATPDMLASMTSYSELSFLAISGTSLVAYLDGALDKLNEGQIAHWNSVIVYFAS